MGQMPLEIEAKLAVADHGPVRAALVAARAERVGAYLESNLMFDRADGSLRAGGCGLRVREMRSLDDGAISAAMTYKGPPQPAAFKTRVEIESRVDRAAIGRALLEALGFVVTLAFQKRRERWRLGECTVELDELPELGCFVEIEGPDEAAIGGALKQLGLDGMRQEVRAYASMVAAHLEARPGAARELRFGNADSLRGSAP